MGWNFGSGCRLSSRADVPAHAGLPSKTCTLAGGSAFHPVAFTCAGKLLASASKYAGNLAGVGFCRLCSDHIVVTDKETAQTTRRVFEFLAWKHDQFAVGDCALARGADISGNGCHAKLRLAAGNADDRRVCHVGHQWHALQDRAVPGVVSLTKPARGERTHGPQRQRNLARVSR